MSGQSSFLAAALTLACSSRAKAVVTEFNNKASWQSTVGAYTTIPFTGFPDNTLITTQYANEGVTFTDGSDFIYLSSSLFLNDGAGLYGAVDSISVSFSQPMTSIAVEFPGTLAFRLYSDAQLIYESTHMFGGVGVGFFGGLVSTETFDAAVIWDPLGGVVIDDLFFGPPIPAPGALAMLAFAAALGGGGRRRRRKSP